MCVGAEDYRRSILPSSSPISGQTSFASLASWEFEDGSKDGWAAAPPESMEADVYSIGGELRVDISGSQPHFDSARMLIPVPDR